MKETLDTTDTITQTRGAFAPLNLLEASNAQSKNIVDCTSMNSTSNAFLVLSANFLVYDAWWFKAESYIFAK